MSVVWGGNGKQADIMSAYFDVSFVSILFRSLHHYFKMGK